MSQDAIAGHVDPRAHLMRRRHWVRGTDGLRAELRNARDPHQAHRRLDLVLEYLKDSHKAIFARGGEPPSLNRPIATTSAPMAMALARHCHAEYLHRR